MSTLQSTVQSIAWHRKGYAINTNHLRCGHPPQEQQLMKEAAKKDTICLEELQRSTAKVGVSLSTIITGCTLLVLMEEQQEERQDNHKKFHICFVTSYDGDTRSYGHMAASC